MFNFTCIFQNTEAAPVVVEVEVALPPSHHQQRGPALMSSCGWTYMLVEPF